MADDQDDTLYESAERIVDACLRKAHRLHVLLTPPSLPSIDRIAGTGAATVPSDVRCWLLDIDRITAATGRWGSGWYVHPAAPDVVVGILVRGEKYRTLGDRHGASTHSVGVILRGAVMSILLQMAAAGLEYEHKENAA